MDPQDSDLMRRWQEGDAGAFEVLVRRWQQPLGRFLSRLLDRQDLVADLCQEVFLRLYLKGPAYRENGTFSTWLYRIALNVARDAFRRERRAPLPLHDIEPPMRGPDGAGVCEQVELVEVMRRALAHLPEAVRVALVLRYYEGMSFEQMARLLETPASTLKSRFAAALNQLRDHLGQSGYCPEKSQQNGDETFRRPE